MMKTKRFTIFFGILCCLCMLLTFPTVAKSAKIPKKLTLNRKEILLYPGESKKLIVEKVRPAGASAKVSWKSKKQKVATVSANGKLTAKKPGKTTITATTKKNSRIQAVVQVTVKKPPVKKEKACEVQGKCYAGSDVIMMCDYYAQTYSQHFRKDFSKKYLPKNLVIRSREEFQEIKRIWKKNTNEDFQKTCMAEYEKVDFSKQSLILLYTEHSGKIVSCNTKFDDSGKMRAIVKAQYVRNQEKSIVIPEGLQYSVILCMNKKDEAMIDSFDFEFEKVE